MKFDNALPTRLSYDYHNNAVLRGYDELRRMYNRLKEEYEDRLYEEKYNEFIHETNYMMCFAYHNNNICFNYFYLVNEQQKIMLPWFAGFFSIDSAAENATHVDVVYKGFYNVDADNPLGQFTVYDKYGIEFKQETHVNQYKHAIYVGNVASYANFPIALNNWKKSSIYADYTMPDLNSDAFEMYAPFSRDSYLMANDWDVANPPTFLGYIDDFIVNMKLKKINADAITESDFQIYMKAELQKQLEAKIEEARPKLSRSEQYWPLNPDIRTNYFGNVGWYTPATFKIWAISIQMFKKYGILVGSISDSEISDATIRSVWTIEHTPVIILNPVLAFGRDDKFLSFIEDKTFPSLSINAKIDRVMKNEHTRLMDYSYTKFEVHHGFVGFMWGNIGTKMILTMNNLGVSHIYQDSSMFANSQENMVIRNQFGIAMRLLAWSTILPEFGFEFDAIDDSNYKDWLANAKKELTTWDYIGGSQSDWEKGEPPIEDRGTL